MSAPSLSPEDAPEDSLEATSAASRPLLRWGSRASALSGAAAAVGAAARPEEIVSLRRPSSTAEVSLVMVLVAMPPRNSKAGDAERERVRQEERGGEEPSGATAPMMSAAAGGKRTSGREGGRPGALPK